MFRQWSGTENERRVRVCLERDDDSGNIIAERSCQRCLENRANDVRNDPDLAAIIEDEVRMDLEDFIDLGANLIQHVNGINLIFHVNH